MRNFSRMMSLKQKWVMLVFCTEGFFCVCAGATGRWTVSWWRPTKPASTAPSAPPPCQAASDCGTISVDYVVNLKITCQAQYLWIAAWKQVQYSVMLLSACFTHIDQKINYFSKLGILLFNSRAWAFLTPWVCGVFSRLSWPADGQQGDRFLKNFLPNHHHVPFLFDRFFFLLLSAHSFAHLTSCKS